MNRRLRNEAADLLACCASQSVAEFSTAWIPGRWSRRARFLAAQTIYDVDWSSHSWREAYAEGEARLRGGR